MNKKVIKIVNGVGETFNPVGGTSVTESIVVIMIVATVLYCTVKGIDIPPLITTAFGTVLGWLFKRNSEGDNDE